MLLNELLFFTLAILALSSKTPLVLLLLLLCLAFFVSYISGFIFSKWVSYIIILIFLGGMMVMFLYFCTLSMNLTFHSKNISISMIFLGLFLIFTTMSERSPLMFSSLEQVSMIFSFPSNTMILFFIVYLTFILLISVKITHSFKGAIMKKW